MVFGHHRAGRRGGPRPAGGAHPDRNERVLRGGRRLLGSADRHGRAAGRQRQGQVDPGQLPVLVQEGRAAVRRAVDDPGRHRDGGERQRPDHPARRAQWAERLRRGRADADRDRRRGDDAWGGAAIHPASQVVSGVATDEDGNGVANVYDPADAIAGMAKYLLEFQVQTDPSAAIYAYNHLQSYV